MTGGKKVCVVLPAYDAAKTLARTVAEIPRDIVGDIILVDDAGSDNTAGIAAGPGLFVVRHQKNLGCGGNQKTCYQHALARGADLVVMLHPDFQDRAREFERAPKGTTVQFRIKPVEMRPMELTRRQ